MIALGKKSGGSLDLSLLRTILGVQATHDDNCMHGDQQMSEQVYEVLRSIQANSRAPMKVTTDAYGNIYVRKGTARTTPCIVAHLDTVHPIVDGYRIALRNDTLFAYSRQTREQVGIGGVDKVGVYLVLQALTDLGSLKAVLFRNEEIGNLGSQYSIRHERGFYDGCGFILQCDRKGSTDFVKMSNGVAMTTAAFDKAVAPFLDKHGFIASTEGVGTDVDVLVDAGVGVCAANIASGFFYPHTDKETVSVRHVGRAYALVYDLCTAFRRRRFALGNAVSAGLV